MTIKKPGIKSELRQGLTNLLLDTRRWKTLPPNLTDRDGTLSVTLIGPASGYIVPLKGVSESLLDNQVSYHRRHIYSALERWRSFPCDQNQTLFQQKISEGN